MPPPAQQRLYCKMKLRLKADVLQSMTSRKIIHGLVFSMETRQGESQYKFGQVRIHQQLQLNSAKIEFLIKVVKYRGMEHNKTEEILKQCIKNYNNYGLKPKLMRMQLSEVAKIVEKEKKRLGVKHPKITLENIGLQEIDAKENLYNMAENDAIKITRISSNGLSKIIIGLKARTTVNITLEAGTLLFPEDSIASSTQSLIIRDDISTTVSDCESELSIDTFCFNQELRSPGKDTFYLGKIKSSKFQKGMNQSQVWDITQKQRQAVRQLEDRYEKEERLSTSASEGFIRND